jgi:multiple sugar transport system permease protein
MTAIHRFRHLRHRIISLLLVLVIGTWCLAPLLWIVITSFKPPGTEYRMPVEYWPSEPTLDNYRTALGPRFRIQLSILNSLLVASGALVLGLLISTLAAYAIARLRFRYRYAALFFTQIGGMVPPIIVIAPIFVMMRAVGLLRTHWAMIIPNAAFDIPLSTWLIASYFANIPFELEESARLDGCGTMRTIFSVILPVAMPGIFTAGILAFLGTWGEFMLAMTVSLGQRSLETVPVTILSFSRMFELQWSWVAAGTVITLVPLIAGVLLLQRVIVQGLTSGASKY